MPILRDRPDCPICGAVHSEFNRVNWWDHNGSPYGPKTKPEGAVIMCDECAKKRFSWKEDILCHLVVEEQRGMNKGLKNLLADTEVNLEQYEEDLDNSIIFVAKVKDVIVGVISFVVTRESDTKKRYFITVNGFYVNPFYRNVGIGLTLFNRMLWWLDDVSVNYFVMGEDIARDTLGYLEHIGVELLNCAKNSFMVKEDA